MLKLEPLLLSADEAAATSSYLRSLQERSSSLLVAAQSLFARCCLAAGPGSPGMLGELGAEADALGQRILHAPQPDQLGLDPVLLIEIYRLLKDGGIEPAAIGALLERVGAELLTQDERIQAMGRVRYIASQLTCLGFSARAAKPTKEMALLMRSPENWFSATAADLAELADHLVADRRRLEHDASQILALIALAELRNYRVDLSCSLLRAVFQLGEPSAEAADALSFIALQRRRDGRYGFSNQFVEASAGADEHLELFLPLTVNAVWLFHVEATYRSPLQPLNA